MLAGHAGVPALGEELTCLTASSSLSRRCCLLASPAEEREGRKRVEKAPNIHPLHPAIIHITETGLMAHLHSKPLWLLLHGGESLQGWLVGYFLLHFRNVRCFRCLMQMHPLQQLFIY